MFEKFSDFPEVALPNFSEWLRDDLRKNAGAFPHIGRQSRNRG
jgi:hypothetical protein